jgi:hypothetical protein
MNGFLLSVCGAAVAFAAGGFLGYRLSEGNHAQADVKAALHSVAVVQRQGQVSTAVAVKQQAQQDHIVYLTRTIIKEAPNVITPEVDRTFPLSVGFVRLHDSSALGQDLSAVSGPSGLPDDAPSPVASSALATTIASNYGECHIDQSRLVALQDWISAQQAIELLR